MKILMLMYEGPEGVAKQTNEESSAYWGAWSAYIDAVKSSGILIGGNELSPKDPVVTLRQTATERIVQDGPFLEAKEMLGGYFELEVPSPEVALEWAARAPLSTGDWIELRPIVERETDELGPLP